MNKVHKAVDYFNKGYSCSQAILLAFGEELGIDVKTASKIACGFGAGCGRQGLICGAVSGAYMVIGMKYGKVRQDDNTAKETTYQKVQEFTSKFTTCNKSINCTDLLGCHIGTPVGMQKAKEEGLFAKVCPEAVKKAAEILIEMHL